MERGVYYVKTLGVGTPTMYGEGCLLRQNNECRHTHDIYGEGSLQRQNNGCTMSKQWVLDTLEVLRVSFKAAYGDQVKV